MSHQRRSRKRRRVRGDTVPGRRAVIWFALLSGGVVGAPFGLYFALRLPSSYFPNEWSGPRPVATSSATPTVVSGARVEFPPLQATAVPTSRFEREAWKRIEALERSSPTDQRTRHVAP